MKVRLVMQGVLQAEEQVLVAERALNRVALEQPSQSAPFQQEAAGRSLKVDADPMLEVSSLPTAATQLAEEAAEEGVAEPNSAASQQARGGHHLPSDRA